MQNYIAQSERTLKEIQSRLKLQTIFISALILLSITLCLMGLKQSVQLKEKDNEIKSMTEIIDNLKGEKNV